MNFTFNDRIRQLILLTLIITLFILLFKELFMLLPGILGGITLYILTSSTYNKLVYGKKWKKGLTAILFIIACLIIIALPVYFAVKMLSPVLNNVMSHPEEIMDGLRSFKHKLEEQFGRSVISEEDIRNFAQNISSLLPKLLNSTMNLLTNLAMMFFLYYFMLISGKHMEMNLRRLIPLKPENISKLAHETKLLIRANALGIPLISFVQGVFASIGFWIFGVDNWGMWGFFSGVFAFFPVVGTMLVWVPLAIAEFIAGNSGMALGLALFNIVVTGNVDYMTRLLFMKKMGDIHPLITIFGVIAGLGMFGFMGLIFGPLLLSYLLILVKIYMNEFTQAGQLDQ
jgi:predicted PurR-regulated permease PerM